MANLICSSCKMKYLNAEKISTIRAGMACPRCNTGILRLEGMTPPIPPRNQAQQTPPPPHPTTPPPQPTIPNMANLAVQAQQARVNLNATSSQKFVEVNVRMSQCMNRAIQPWTSSFQLFYSSLGIPVIEARIRLKVVNGTGQATEEVRRNWGSKIERDWQGFELVDEQEKKWQLYVKMEWVGSKEHYTVTCNRGQSNHGLIDDDGTQHVHSWGEQDGTGGIEDISAISHEVGHMLGNCDEYNYVTGFTGRASGNMNYGAPVAIHTQMKQWNPSTHTMDQVDARRAYYGVPGRGIMGNVAEPPKARNWYLVAREFAKLRHPTEPMFDMRSIKIKSITDATDIYIVETN